MSDQPKTKFLIQINYKSGHSVKLWFDEFKAEYTQTSLKSITYTVSSPMVRPVYLGDIKQIESIYQLDAEERD